MSIDVSKCGKKTAHLKAKDTGKHFVKLLTCNKLECPRCYPSISARIKKKIRYYAQHERLVFFNTITSKNGFDDLEMIFRKIRTFLQKDFSVEHYMKKKKVDYDKALAWYEKKKQKMINEDVLIEIERISRMAAIIEVAKEKNVYYQGMTVDEQREFKDAHAKLIEKRFTAIFNVNRKDQDLKTKLYDKIFHRFAENEHEPFKFIRVIEFHKSGQPHYHFLSNRYVPHSLMKKVTVEGVSEVYDNTYIVEDALAKNPNLTKDDVNTDIVAAYVSKITDYVTKDTVSTYVDLRDNYDFNKKLISSSDGIVIFDEDSLDEPNYIKMGVFDYTLNANSYEVPLSRVSDVEEFIRFHSICVEDEKSVPLMDFIRENDFDDPVKYSYIIAERLRHIATYDIPVPPVSRDFCVFGLTDEQNRLINVFNQNRITLLIGRAGTGKSFTIVNLLKELKPNPSTTYILTYTGKASTRLKELLSCHGLNFYKPQTIHKACSSSFNSEFLRNERNTLNCEYLIIDEVSMIPREILAKLLLAVPSYVKVLFAGDDAQLPPVNDVSLIPELRDNPYVRTVELTKVFRSDDSVLKVAHAILNRDSDFLQYELLKEDSLSDVVLSLVEQGYQILVNTKRMMREINMIVQSSKCEIVRCFNDFKYNVGDRVMIVANSSLREVSNGDTGIIESFNDKGVFVRLDHDDRVVFYKYEDTEEIVPAYAFTIHKAQGSEYEKVAIILEEQEKLNTNNLLYTAVTRAKLDVKIYGLYNSKNPYFIKAAVYRLPEKSHRVTINNVCEFIKK